MLNSVQQQISLFGKRALKATPLRDEFDHFKYAFSRPAPVAFHRAMTMLNDLRKIAEQSSSVAQLEDGDEGEAPDESEGGDNNLYSNPSASMSTADSGTSLLYFKLINLDIGVKEKWLDYLKLLHVDMSQNALPNFSKFGESQSFIDSLRAASIKLGRYMTMWERRQVSLWDRQRELADAKGFVDIGVLIPLLDDIAQIAAAANDVVEKTSQRPGSQPPKSPKASYRSTKVTSRSLTASSDTRMLSRQKSRAVSVGPVETALGEMDRAHFHERQAHRISGYELLWNYGATLFGEDVPIEVLEITAMSLEDYSSAVSETLYACEIFIAQCAKDSFERSDKTDVVKALPFSSAIGFPLYYVNQCLMEPPKAVAHSDGDSVSGHSKAESSAVSSTLSQQIKRKRKESKKHRRKVGKRFALRSVQETADMYTDSQSLLTNDQLMDDMEMSSLGGEDKLMNESDVSYFDGQSYEQEGSGSVFEKEHEYTKHLATTK
jgi:hypothetical protein